MRLWLNRTGEVSLREQLITQVQLAILCRELLPGQRLPSIRELARRHGIHSNTVSGAYSELEAEGWLELRRGSGVYVRNTLPAGPTSPEYATDEIPILDPKTGKVTYFKAPVRDPGMPEMLGPGNAAMLTPLQPSAYWGNEQIWDTRVNNDNSMFDNHFKCRRVDNRDARQLLQMSDRRQFAFN